MSASVEYGPRDSQCHYWAKIIRRDTPLPLPEAVTRGDDVPGEYRRAGDDEMEEGDVIIDGEANHHKYNRGYTYNIGYVHGDEVLWLRPGAKTKAVLKERGLPTALLRGSGDLAACVRVAHAIRLGLYGRGALAAEPEPQVVGETVWQQLSATDNDVTSSVTLTVEVAS